MHYLKNSYHEILAKMDGNIPYESEALSPLPPGFRDTKMVPVLPGGWLRRRSGLLDIQGLGVIRPCWRAKGPAGWSENANSGLKCPAPDPPPPKSIVTLSWGLFEVPESKTNY